MLRCSFELKLDEYEERVEVADAVERARARVYLDMLSIDEWERAGPTSTIGAVADRFFAAEVEEEGAEARVKPADRWLRRAGSAADYAGGYASTCCAT